MIKIVLGDHIEVRIEIIYEGQKRVGRGCDMINVPLSSCMYKKANDREIIGCYNGEKLVGKSEVNERLPGSSKEE